jgi:hypothetical protein
MKHFTFSAPPSYEAEPALEDSVSWNLASRSAEVLESINAVRRYQSEANRRVWGRRLTDDRRAMQESWEDVSLPHERRSSHRRGEDDRRLPVQERLQELQQELKTILNHQIELHSEDML